MKCSFCGNEIERGTGIIFVTNEGKQILFCSSKCEKNHKLGRIGRNVEWVRKKK